MEKVILQEKDINRLINELANKIRFNSSFLKRNDHMQVTGTIKNPINIYGVPRGGIPVAYRIAHILKFNIVDTVKEADIIVDDIVSSGRTREEMMKGVEHIEFYSLIDGQCDCNAGKWFVFPWEIGLEGADESATDIPTRLIEFIGEDVTREGLVDTPKRFIKAWKFLTSGYNEDPKEILKTRFTGESKNDNIVQLDDIEFYSICEHHLLPFLGKVSISYIPDGCYLGISKLARLVNCFARRVQIQERLTNQIANTLQKELNPQGVYVECRAQHLCMLARGVQKSGSMLITEARTGVFRESVQHFDTK